MMRKLILIRHSNSKLDPQLPTHHWGLIEGCRARCLQLADFLCPRHLGVIVTSVEPKAVQTGEILAQKLAFPCQVSDGLHQHERGS